jgi:hypothetical protein
LLEYFVVLVLLLDEVDIDTSDPLGDVDLVGDTLACFSSSAEITVITNGGCDINCFLF